MKRLLLPIMLSLSCTTVVASEIPRLDFIASGITKNFAESLWKDAYRDIDDWLKDRDSAKFRCISVSPSLDGKFLVIFGDVNAKNQYGGYTGYSTFYMIYETDSGDLKDIVSARNRAESQELVDKARRDPRYASKAVDAIAETLHILNFHQFDSACKR